MELWLVVKTLEEKKEVLWIMAYVVDADVPFLIGRSTLEKWNSKLNTVDKILETDMGEVKSKFKMINTGGNHFGLKIEKGDCGIMKKEKGRIKWLDKNLHKEKDGEKGSKDG